MDSLASSSVLYFLPGSRLNNICIILNQLSLVTTLKMVFQHFLSLLFYPFTQYCTLNAKNVLTLVHVCLNYINDESYCVGFFCNTYWPM